MGRRCDPASLCSGPKPAPHKLAASRAGQNNSPPDATPAPGPICAPASAADRHWESPSPRADRGEGARGVHGRVVCPSASREYSGASRRRIHHLQWRRPCPGRARGRRRPPSSSSSGGGSSRRTRSRRSSGRPTTQRRPCARRSRERRSSTSRATFCAARSSGAGGARSRANATTDAPRSPRPLLTPPLGSRSALFAGRQAFFLQRKTAQSRSTRSRGMGNDAFRAKNYARAVEHYTNVRLARRRGLAPPRLDRPHPHWSYTFFFRSGHRRRGGGRQGRPAAPRQPLSGAAGAGPPGRGERRAANLCRDQHRARDLLYANVHISAARRSLPNYKKQIHARRCWTRASACSSMDPRSQQPVPAKKFKII